MENKNEMENTYTQIYNVINDLENRNEMEKIYVQTYNEIKPILNTLYLKKNTHVLLHRCA